MKKKQGGIHLRTKFMLSSFVLTIAICITLLSLAYRHFSSAMETMYEERLTGIVQTAAAYIPQDRMRAYIAAVEAGMDPGEVIDEAYLQMQAQFRILSEKNDLVYLYSYHPVQDGLYVFVQGTQADNPFHYQLGDFLAAGREYSYEDIAYANALLNDPETPKLLLSQSQYGNLMTIFTVLDDEAGAPYMVVGADINIQTVQHTLHAFLRSSIFTAVLFLCLFQLIYQAYMRRKMINPLQKVIDAAVSFVSTADDAENLCSLQLDVDTGDEIEALAEAFNQMTSDIVQYIHDIKSATAERERISAELRVATTIQSSFLPRNFPVQDAYTLYATMTPAKEVGGDFYDFFMLDEDHLAIVIADVSGKGIPAALFMVNAKNAIKDLALTGQSPAAVFTGANAHLCENNEAEMFVTAWMGILELSTGKLSAVNAGHNPPLIRQGRGAYAYTPFKAGFVLAGMEGLRYRETTMQLAPGSSIFLYTDGVTEATDANDALFGEDRLLETLNREENMLAAPEALLPAVKKSLDLFVQDAPQFDDITMLCVAYTGANGRQKEDPQP